MLVYAVLCRCPWSIEISQNPSSNFRKLFFSLSLSFSDLVFTGHLVYFKILSVMWCERIVGLLQICCQKVCFPNGLGSFLKMKVKSSLWKGAWCHTLAKRWVVLGILTQIFSKSLELFFHTLWKTVLNLRPACHALVCVAKK